VAALRRLNPQVLRNLLAIFPGFAKERGIALPPKATAEKLEYEKICAALMGDAVPADLDEVLFLASKLGNSRGWEAIEDQAREDRRPLPLRADMGDADLAILLAIEDWPKHRLFLERANARARVNGKSAFVYYPPARDWRSHYMKPTGERLTEARDYLAQHFVDCGFAENVKHGRATEIIPYDFEKEIWFLIRYPGRLRRQSGCCKTGTWESYVFNPEQYDAVVYNKVYCDLRMNTHRKTEHVKYRIACGRLLFGDDTSNAFLDKVPVVTLEPLMGERSAELFNSKDIPGLASIMPVETYYEKWGFPPRQFTEKNKNGCSVLSGAPYGTRVLPEDALTALRLVVAYTLDNGHKGKLTLHQVGNRVNFERDGDSVVLEKWLRDRQFVKDFVEVAADASKAA